MMKYSNWGPGLDPDLTVGLKACQHLDFYRRRLRRANAAPLLYLGLRLAFEACVGWLMGSVPLMGVLYAWGGTLLYF